MRAHFQGYLRFRVVAAVGNSGGRFFDYVETVTARSKIRPLAYETVRKAFFTHFLALHETDESVSLASEMRDLERDNLARLMGLFTEKVLANQFDLSKGIYKIEERLATDPSIRDPHLRAYRLCRQAPLIVLMKELRDAIAQLLALRGRYKNPAWREDQVLWAGITEDDWGAVGRMLDLAVNHKVWIERNEAYARYLQDTRKGSWEAILVRGTFPGAEEAVYEPLNHSAFLRYATP